MSPSSEIVESPPVSLDGTFGAILIGTFIGLVLYGMVIHQTYRYSVLYREDGVWLKSLVAIIFILETFHIVSSTHICYFYLVKHYDDPKRLLTGAWSINSLTATSGVVIMLSQSFFARRVYLLGRYRVVVYLSVACLLGELGFFAAATAKAFILPVLSEFQHCTWLISTGAAMAQVADVLLTTTLMIMLRKSRTGVKRMDTVIDALMLYAVNTGMLTSIVNSLTFIFSLLLPKDLIYGAMGIVATKLYANSLLAA
ncbi:hypothetical protein C8Q74DRAFT_668293 [Fomes fomentarius]|nr:hypothetical protein C8Q74DRAFT_668293 [Fomes fomentarius]